MKLKELRKQNNKTQQDLATYLNIARSTYNGYELENNEPNLDTLIKLADFYNVTLDYLVGRNYKNELGYMTQDQYETIKMFLALPIQQQLKIQGRIMECYENL